MFTFPIDYYLFVFIAGIGVIQISVSIGPLRGLLIIKPPIASRILGISLTIAAFIWFFTSDFRNINDYEGGLDGNLQAILFSLGITTSVISTLVLSSITNARMIDKSPAHHKGLDTLQNTNYITSVTHSLQQRWKK